MTLAEKLIYLRKEKGLSQLKLAEMMDISRQAVSRWETGTAIPSLNSLKYLSRLYEVSLDYLSGDTSDEAQQEKDAVAIPVDKPDLPQEQEDIPDNRKIKRWRIVVAGLVLLLSVCVYMIVFVEKGGDSVLIDDMPKEEVEISIGSGFDIEF